MLGSIVSQLRRAQDLTQEQLAEKVGVSQAAIYQWEQGLTSPSTANLRRLATALNVTADMLLYDGLQPLERFLAPVSNEAA